MGGGGGGGGLYSVALVVFFLLLCRLLLLLIIIITIFVTLLLLFLLLFSSSLLCLSSSSSYSPRPSRLPAHSRPPPILFLRVLFIPSYSLSSSLVPFYLLLPPSVPSSFDPAPSNIPSLSLRDDLTSSMALYCGVRHECGRPRFNPR